MIAITIYDLDTGEITSTKHISAEHEISDNVPPDRGYILGYHDAETEHIDHGLATKRPLVPPMTGMSYDLSALPVGATVTVADQEGAETIVQAQTDMLTLIDPGKYLVRSDSPFPWIDFDVEVIVK